MVDAALLAGALPLMLGVQVAVAQATTPALNTVEQETGLKATRLVTALLRATTAVAVQVLGTGTPMGVEEQQELAETTTAMALADRVALLDPQLLLLMVQLLITQVVVEADLGTKQEAIQAIT